MARIELSNIGGGGGTTLSLTTTGTSGAATLAGSVLNIPVYQGQLTLTTTGTSGAATLSGDILNIPQYSGGGGTPAGSTGQIQYNNAGAFGASSNLAWVNSPNPQLNIGAPSAPTGRLNVRGGGTTSSTVNLRLTDSGSTELLKVLDNGNTNIGTGFNWDNVNNRLGIGTASPSFSIDVNSASAYFGLNRTSGANPALFFFRLAGTGGANVGIAGAPGDQLPSSVANDLFFRTNGYSILFGSLGTTLFAKFNSTGNFSVGSSSDSGDRLQIYGSSLLRGSNTSGGTNALLVQNSTPSDLYKIENNGKISYLATNTAAGTTGAQTINRPSGTVNFGIGAGSLVVTNSLCTTSSIVFATVRTNDATAYIKNVVPAAGSFTINLGANATAETSVGFFIIN